jgi:hypothetical protein
MPINSSQLDKQAIENAELQKYYDKFGYDINEWYETDTFDENVYSNLSTLKMLYITGGEPTLIQKNFKLLELLIERGYSKNIFLIINSNMTNDKPIFFDLVSQFKEVLFFVSIDGYDKIQEYLRYPSDWNQISNNMEKLVARGAENITIKVSPVVQVTNLSNITDLFEYCEEFNRKAGKNIVDIFINNLENPDYLNFINLPLNYKTKCWEKIDNWVKNKCTYQKPLFHSQLESVKKKCLVDVDYQEKLDRFFDFNGLVDKHQKLTLQEINPELYKILHK